MKNIEDIRIMWKGIGLTVVFLILAFAVWGWVLPSMKECGAYQLPFVPAGLGSKGRTGKIPLVASGVIHEGERDLIFIGGGEGQSDALLGWDMGEKRFVVVREVGAGKGKRASTCMCVCRLGDESEDDDDTILVGRRGGVYALRNGGRVTQKLVSIPEGFLPSCIAVASIRSPFAPLDIFIGLYTENDSIKPFSFGSDGAPPSLLLRRNSVKDTFKPFWNYIRTTRNIWTATFVDIDGYDLPSLALAYDEGPITILHNQNGYIQEKPLYEGPVGFWMGCSAVVTPNGKYIELLFSNSGGAVSKRMMKHMGFVPGTPGSEDLTSDHFLITIERKTGKIGEESLSGGFGWGTVSEQITYAAQGEDETPTLVHVMAQNWRAITTQFVPAIRSPGLIIDSDKTSESALSIYDVPNRHFGVTPLFAEVVPKELWLVWVNHREKPIAYKLKAVASAKTGYVRGPGTAGNVFDWRDDHAILVTSGGTGLGSSQRVF